MLVSLVVFGCPLTRRNSQQLLLHSMYHLFDLLSWSSPEDKAMAGILEPRFDGRITQSQQYRIYVYTWEVLVKHLGLLLRIPRGPVQLVLFLDSYLRCLISTCKDQILKNLTGSSSHADINASYGLLKEEVETPVRSSNVLTA